MSEIIKKHGGMGAIPFVEVKCKADEFENSIREIGVVFACDWFGFDKNMTIEVIKTLCESSGLLIDDDDNQC